MNNLKTIISLKIAFQTELQFYAFLTNLLGYQFSGVEKQLTEVQNTIIKFYGFWHRH